MKTRTWKVYGKEGHTQRESYNSSAVYDFTEDDNIRVIEVLNADYTHTTSYTVVRITRNSAEECKNELLGQLTDGIFENSGTGAVQEVFEISEKEAARDALASLMMIDLEEYNERVEEARTDYDADDFSLTHVSPLLEVCHVHFDEGQNCIRYDAEGKARYFFIGGYGYYV